MIKHLLLVGAAIALPVTASAAPASANTQLTGSNVTFNFTGPADPTGGNVFSLNSAAFNGAGVNSADTMTVPGTADAPTATDGPISADSAITVTSSGGSFSTLADGTVFSGDFGSATGRVTAEFSFTTTIPDTQLTLTLDLNRIFSLTSVVGGDSASGRTALALGILTSTGIELAPTVVYSNPMCNPNFAQTAVNGNTFSDNCTTSATFVWVPFTPGSYTLTFGASSNIDVVAANVAVAEPGVLALLGLGLIGVAASRRKRR